MKTFKKKGNRELRVSKVGSAAEAIGRIEKGSDTFVLTFGQFSLIDALVVILDQTGPADVALSTWTAADAHLERAKELLENAAIRSFRMIIDRSFEGRQPGYCYHMRKLFGADCIRAIRTHAKFALVRSDSHDVVVRTSMNLNENPRLENIEISEGREFAEFFEAVVADVFSETGANENRSAMLDLKGLEDSSPYKGVAAEQIRRERLNECETSHQIKKLE